MLAWILFEILLTSAVICKKRFLHENEIMQYLKSCKYQDFKQGHFRKALQASTNTTKTAALQDSIHFSRAVQF